LPTTAAIGHIGPTGIGSAPDGIIETLVGVVDPSAHVGVAIDPKGLWGIEDRGSVETREHKTGGCEFYAYVVWVRQPEFHKGPLLPRPPETHVC